MQKKLVVEFVAYVDESLSVNDYINPFTDEKYRESLRDLINDNGGAIVCVGLVNMRSKPVTIHKDQTIAVLAVRGEHEFLKVAHKEFPCEKVDGWDNYESKEDRRRSLKDERCISNDGDDMSECCCDGF